MMAFLRNILLTMSAFFFAVALLGGCHTAQGVKQDTKSAVRDTGHGVKKTGEKLENAGKK